MQIKWDRLVVERFEGNLPCDEKFVTQVNFVTAQSFGKAVPLQETYEHLNGANLGHFIFVEGGSDRQLIAYMLNDLFEIEVKNCVKKVNYISSAFILPSTREKIAVLRFMGSIGVNWDDDVYMIRTQNPMIMSFFAWLSEFRHMKLYTHIDVLKGHHIPNDCYEAIRQKFMRPAFIVPYAYERLLTADVIEPKTTFTKMLMNYLQVERGDAMFMVAIKL